MRRILRQAHISTGKFTREIWFNKKHRLFLPFLKTLSKLYYFTLQRKKQEQKSLEELFIVCVGGIVTGGSGKTPTSIALYEQLAKSGKKIGFLTRGYVPFEKAITYVIKLEKGIEVTTKQVGDEAILLSKVATTYVSSNRLRAAETAAKDGIEILIMDDGLQNSKLESDYKVCVFDSEFGIGNGYLLPAGPLRERGEGSLDSLDKIVLIMRSETLQEQLQSLLTKIPEEKIIRAHVKAKNSEKLYGKQYICFAGIGHPEKFFDSARQVGVKIIATFSFPDHYCYENEDLRAIYKPGCRVLTTAKDYQRIPNEFQKVTDVLEIEFNFESKSFAEEILVKAEKKLLDKRRNEV